MREIQLSNGAHVRVRPMPPHVVVMFNRNVGKSLPPEPQPPVKTVTMADGHTEQDTVTEDSPEWKAYQVKRDEWAKVCDDLIVDANDDFNTLQRDYAIIEWSFDGEQWRKDAPPEWEYPEALMRGNIGRSGNNRVDYIALELLTTAEDWALVRAIAEGETTNITDEELGAVRAGFRTGDGRARDTTAKKQGWIRRMALKISRGNDSG